MTPEPSPPRSLAHFLALNRTVAVVLLAVLFFGLGEQLWEPFMGVYLTAQVEEAKSAAKAGAVSLAALWTIGTYAALRNLFEACCYVGGGHLTARLGDRGSLLLFGTASVAGYLLLLVWQTPAATVVAALLILGWEPLSVPVTFTTVGSTVDKSRQGMAFALQSIQKRLPKVLGPLAASWVLWWAEGRTADKDAAYLVGMRVLVAIALGLAVVSLAVQARWMPHRAPPPRGPSARQVLREMHPTLRRLLLAEVFTRWCDWLVRELVVVYVLVQLETPVRMVGVLMAAQHLTALLTYLPVGRMTKTVGLQPFVGLTFVFFALFPLALALSPPGWWLLAPFVVYGLREIGEPARKALITSLFPEAVRARGVGLYWGLRGLAVCPASLVGALLWWQLGPKALLYSAFGFGCAGAAVFYLLCRKPADVRPR